MEKIDWRFEIMCAIRLSFREGWTLDELKARIDEIWKQYEFDQFPKERSENITP